LAAGEASGCLYVRMLGPRFENIGTVICPNLHRDSEGGVTGVRG